MKYLHRYGLCIVVALAAFVIWRRWREGKTTDAAAFATGITAATIL